MNERSNYRWFKDPLAYVLILYCVMWVAWFIVAVVLR